MKIKSRTIAALIITSAIIWAAVILGCASALQGTECYSKIQLILSGGVISHILFVWGPLAAIFRKK